MGEAFKHYTVMPPSGEIGQVLPNLAKINILVGANNSGKSRFMRQLAATEKLTFVPKIQVNGKDAPFGGFQEARDWLDQQIAAVLQRKGFTDGDHIREKLSQMELGAMLQEKSMPGRGLLNLLEEIRTKSGVSQWVHAQNVGVGSHIDLFPQIKSLAAQCKEKIAALPVDLYEFIKIYIPTLRGLRGFPNTEDCYRERTTSDYFRGPWKPEIFTGLTLYEDIKKLLLGNLEERDVVADFQSFLSKEFFDNQPLALIPKLAQTVLDIKIGQEREYPIYALGDGIQSIIILTFPLFKNHGKKVLAFIEEPELFMHPGLQNVLLKVLNSFPDFQYIMTTHSNHFLDLTLDLESVSVYTFRKPLETGDKREKEARFEVENVTNQSSRSLEVLGVRNSSVFLSNCTIWVEGITDRRYFSHFLRLFQEKLLRQTSAGGSIRFKEDLHFSFVEYAGSNITHWSFLDVVPDAVLVDRLCGRLFLITDRDNADGGGKKQRHENLRLKLGDRYCCLECRELENLLTPEVIKKVVQEYEGGNAQLNEFAQQDYKAEGLGKFIEEKVLLRAKVRKGAYRTESGSLSDKVGFCHKALTHVRSFDDLSEGARQLTKKLHEFIEKHNS